MAISRILSPALC